MGPWFEVCGRKSGLHVKRWEILRPPPNWHSRPVVANYMHTTTPPSRPPSDGKLGRFGRRCLRRRTESSRSSVLAGDSLWGAVTGTVPGDDTRCGTRFLLGAYVLGGLSEREEAAIEAHLSHCAHCQAECEELACVPEWLDLISTDAFPMAPVQRRDALQPCGPGEGSDVSGSPGSEPH